MGAIQAARNGQHLQLLLGNVRYVLMEAIVVAIPCFSVDDHVTVRPSNIIRKAYSISNEG